MTEEVTDSVTEDNILSGDKPAEDNILDNTEDGTAGDGKGANTQGDKTTDGGDKPGDKSTEGGDKAEGDSDGDGKSKAPEQYETFSMPDGMEVDTEMVEQFTPIAKELSLSQEDAQKLVGLYATKVQEQVASAQNEWAKVQDGWRQTAKADEEIGGGAFKDSVALAKKALNTLGTPELVEALNQTGMANHPEMIRFAYNVGKTISEDNMGSGKGKANEIPQNQASRMFPSMNSENQE